MKRFHYRQLPLFLLGALLAEGASAQLLRGLQNRIVEAVERRVEQNVEERVVNTLEQSATQAVDESFASLFGEAGLAENGMGAGSPALLSRMLDTSNIVVEDEYRFDVAALFEVQSFDGNGRASEAMELEFHYAADAPYTGTRMISGDAANAGAAMIIYDFDNQVMLMLMDSDGSRFAMPFNWAIAAAEWDTAWELPEQEGAAAPVAGEMPTFERIGSRRISGYQSEGFRTRSEEQVTEIWVSDEVAPGIERIFQANRTVPLLNSSMPAGYPQGMLMELNSENTQTGETVQMRTKSIDTNSRVSFRMSDYPLMSLGAQPGQ